MITRRNFNKLSFIHLDYILYQNILYAQNYKGPINWVGSSFLTRSDVEKDFPISKPASEILM